MGRTLDSLIPYCTLCAIYNLQGVVLTWGSVQNRHPYLSCEVVQTTLTPQFSYYLPLLHGGVD